MATKKDEAKPGSEKPASAASLNVTEEDIEDIQEAEANEQLSGRDVTIYFIPGNTQNPRFIQFAESGADLDKMLRSIAQGRDDVNGTYVAHPTLASYDRAVDK